MGSVCGHSGRPLFFACFLIVFAELHGSSWTFVEQFPSVSFTSEWYPLCSNWKRETYTGSGSSETDAPRRRLSIYDSAIVDSYRSIK